MAAAIETNGVAEQEVKAGFDSLIASLFEDIVPRLERFPKLGRDFLSRDPLSDEGKAKLHALKTNSGRHTEIREYTCGDYLLLYAARDSVVFLLAIRRHCQLSSDLRAHWV